MSRWWGVGRARVHRPLQDTVPLPPQRLWAIHSVPWQRHRSAQSHLNSDLVLAALGLHICLGNSRQAIVAGQEHTRL